MKMAEAHHSQGQIAFSVLDVVQRYGDAGDLKCTAEQRDRRLLLQHVDVRVAWPNAGYSKQIFTGNIYHRISGYGNTPKILKEGYRLNSNHIATII